MPWYTIVALILWTALTINHATLFLHSVGAYQRGVVKRPIIIHFWMVWLLHILLPFFIFWDKPVPT